MYGLCSSNALYSAGLSFIFIFLLTPIDTWSCYYMYYCFCMYPIFCWDSNVKIVSKREGFGKRYKEGGMVL